MTSLLDTNWHASNTSFKRAETETRRNLGLSTGLPLMLKEYSFARLTWPQSIPAKTFWSIGSLVAIISPRDEASWVDVLALAESKGQRTCFCVVKSK